MTLEVGHCVRCACDVRPIVEFSDRGRAIDVCPKCQAPVSAIVEAGDVPEASPPAATPSSGKSSPRTPDAPARGNDTNVDLLDLARRQLAALELEIEALESKLEQARMLRRMIAAAEIPEH